MKMKSKNVLHNSDFLAQVVLVGLSPTIPSVGQENQACFVILMLKWRPLVASERQKDGYFRGGFGKVIPSIFKIPV